MLSFPSFAVNAGTLSSSAGSTSSAVASLAMDLQPRLARALFRLAQIGAV
jgi:hypothetical protein